MRDSLWTQGQFSIVDNELWFVSMFNNLFCKYNLESEKTDVILWPLSEKNNFGFFDVKALGDFVVAIPAFEDGIILYQRSVKSLDVIPLRKNRKYTLEKFCGGIVYENNVFMLPVDYDGIVQLNCVNKTVQYIDIGDYGMITGYVREENYIYCINGTNKLLIFDCRNHAYEIITCSENMKFFNILKLRDRELYLWDDRGRIYTFDARRNDICFLTDCLKVRLSSVVLVDDAIWAFPFEKSDCFYVTNIKGQDVKKYECIGESVSYPFNSFSQAFVSEKFVYVMNTEQHCLMLIDKQTKELNKKYILLQDTEEAEDYFADRLSSKGILAEDAVNLFTLDKLIKYIKDNS